MRSTASSLEQPAEVMLKKWEWEIFEHYKSVWGHESVHWITSKNAPVKILLFMDHASYWTMATIGVSEALAQVPASEVKGQKVKDLQRVELIGYISPSWKIPKSFDELTENTWFAHGLFSIAQYIRECTPFVDHGHTIPNITQKPFGMPVIPGSLLTHWVAVNSSFNEDELTDPGKKFSAPPTKRPGAPGKTRIRFLCMMPATDKEAAHIQQYGYEHFDRLCEVNKLEYSIVTEPLVSECVIEKAQALGIDVHVEDIDVGAINREL